MTLRLKIDHITFSEMNVTAKFQGVPSIGGLNMTGWYSISFADTS